jgi:hypothetical protein
MAGLPGAEQGLLVSQGCNQVQGTHLSDLKVLWCCLLVDQGVVLTRVLVCFINNSRVCRKKMSTSAEMLCRMSHPAFRDFTDAVVNLKFEEVCV